MVMINKSKTIILSVIESIVSNHALSLGVVLEDMDEDDDGDDQ
jgi:hypothetical protein